MLTQTAFLLFAAVILVPLAKRLGLGAVLGYLVAGVLLGPWGLGLIRNVEAILHFGEFGVVLLLFVIGLELKPSRLWVLRRPVFGLGSLQVWLTALAVAALAAGFGLDARAAVVIGLAAAMSSTAMVLQSLAERNQLPDRHGRDALLERDFRATRLHSSGGFLKQSNATVMLGVEDDEVDEVMGIVRENCHSRSQIVNPMPPIMEPGEFFMPYPLEVEVGGATVFVVPVERFERL